MEERCRIRVEGPLAPYLAGFWSGLLSQGYLRLSAEKQVGLMAHLSRWLEGDGLEVSELTSELAGKFLRDRRAQGYATFISPKSAGAVLGYLRVCGARARAGPGGRLSVGGSSGGKLCALFGLFGGGTGFGSGHRSLLRRSGSGVPVGSSGAAVGWLEPTERLRGDRSCGGLPQ